MTTYGIATSTDDAHESAGTVDTNSGTNTITGGSPVNYTGVRFASVSWDALGSAYLIVAPNNASKNDDCDMNIYGHAHDNSPTFTAGAGTDVSGRARTSASVVWTQTLVGLVYTKSPNITAIVLEIMNRPGWVSGNAITLILEGRGSGVLVIDTFDTAPPNRPPLLDVTTSVPAFNTREAPGHLAPSSAWHTQMFSWQDRGPDVPAYPFADVVQPRRPRGFRPIPGKRSETVRPQVNPPIPVQVTQQRKVRGLLRFPGRRAETVRPQVNPPIPVQETARFKPLRGFLRRGKSAEVVRVQVNPPYPISEVVRPKPLRALLRRGRMSETVRPQVNPPLPINETVRPKPIRSLLRRGRTFEPIRSQVNPPYPWAEVRRGKFGFPRFAGRRAETVRPQVNPPIPIETQSQPRTARGFLSRRGKSAEVVPTQQVIVPTTLVPSVSKQPRRIRGMLSRRGRVADPIRAQVNPPLPIERRKQAPAVRGQKPRQVKRSEVVAPQTAPIEDRVQPRRLRGMLPRRVRKSETVRAQQNPPMPIERRRAPWAVRGMKPRQVKKSETVRAQVNPPYPVEAKRQPRRLRALFTRRAKRNDGFSSAPVVPAGSAVVTLLGAPAVTLTMAGAPSASVALTLGYRATITMNAAFGATVTLNDAPSAQID